MGAKSVFIVLDVETGGLDSDKHPITQIAFKVVEPTKFAVLEQWSTFIKPYDELTITQDALNHSRVTIDEINAGISADKALEHLIITIKKHIPKGSKARQNLPIMVGHNIPFDRNFIKYLFSRRAKDVDDFLDVLMYDTLRMIIDYEMNVKDADKLNNKLSIVCQRYGIKLKAAHVAAADVEATLQLFKLLMTRFRSNKNNKDGVILSQEVVGDTLVAETKARKYFELP